MCRSSRTVVLSLLSSENFASSLCGESQAPVDVFMNLGPGVGPGFLYYCAWATLAGSILFVFFSRKYYEKKPIRSILNFIWIGFAFLLFCFGLSFSMIVSIQSKRITFIEENFKAGEYISQLRLSIGSLGEFAHNFVMTEELKFKDLHELFFNVQEGKVEPPEDFSYHFWWIDQIGSNAEASGLGSGEVANLWDRAEDFYFTTQEELLIYKAHQAALQLYSIEFQAISAAFDNLANQNEKGSGQSIPGIEYAQSLLHGDEYLECRIKFFEALDKFWIGHLERDRLEEEKLDAAFHDVLKAMAIYLVSMVIFFVIAFKQSVSKVVVPILELGRKIEATKSGEMLKFNTKPLGKETSKLVDSFAHLTDKFAEHRIELQKSEARLKFLLSHSPVVFYAKLAVPPHAITFISSNIADLAGFSERQLLEEAALWTELVHPSDIKTYGDHVKSATDQVKTAEYRLCCADGSYKWISDELHVTSGTGGAAELVGCLHDVTETRKNESELKKLSVAIEKGPAMVVVTDAKGNIEYVNAAFCECSGYTVDEVLGKNPRILKAEGMVDKSVYDDLWETVTSGKVWSGELCNKKKCGDLYWESVTIAPVVNDDSTIEQFVGLKINITERKRIEEKVVKQNSRLNSLQNVLSQPLYTDNEILHLLLKESCKVLDMDRAMVVEVKEGKVIERHVYPKSATPVEDQVLNLKDTFYDIVDASVGPIMEDNVASSAYGNTDCFKETGFVAYAGVKLITSKGYFGMLCLFKDSYRKKNFELQDKDYLVTTAGLCSVVIDRLISNARLEVSLNEVKELNSVMMGRELRIIELKRELNDICRKFGMENVYKPVWESVELD